MKHCFMLRGIYSQLNHLSKFILLVTLVFSFLLFSSLIGILILVPFYGSGVISLLSAPDYTDNSVVNALKVIQIFNMSGGMLLPSLIYLWLCTPQNENYAGFKNPVFLFSVLLSVVLILIAQPIIGAANHLNSYLSLPDGLSMLENWMRNAEKQGEMITQAFLATTSPTGLMINIFMIAILPAFAEELLFRGVLATLFKEWTKNIHLAVFLSSFIFAAIHLQFFGFLPRFLLGIALGYLYLWSGNLWLPIAAHFTNNFLSVLVEFLFRKGVITTNAEEFGNDNAVWHTILSIVCITGILYAIYKQSSENQATKG